MGKQEHKYEPLKYRNETMPSCSCQWTYPGEAPTSARDAKKLWEDHVRKAK